MRSQECAGHAPTDWYVESVSPTLPPWQQIPIGSYPGNPRLDQGKIEIDAFDGFTDAALACWAGRNDKLAAFILGARYARPITAPATEGSIAEHYLRVAAEDDAPAAHCSEAFCHGVPEAMYRLARERRLLDQEYFDLLDRAIEAGFVRAIYARDGIEPPGAESPSSLN